MSAMKVSWAAAPLTPSPSGRPASSVGKNIYIYIYIYIEICKFQISTFQIPDKTSQIQNSNPTLNIKATSYESLQAIFEIHPGTKRSQIVQ